MLTYKKAGVNIDRADLLVEFIQKRAPAIGGFSGLFPLAPNGREKHFLVASTDGVGTKLKIAFLLNKHETVGMDLVAMCVNDLITCGAKPLFFLDYYATGRLDLNQGKRVLQGIFKGCREGGMILLGGETAEMPGFYSKGEYDLAGFAVGIVSESKLVDGSRIRPGDAVMGLPSSGIHSNGFSLIRKAFSVKELNRMGSRFLAPTKIYVRPISRLEQFLCKQGRKILGLAHITGGGLLENIPRVLPKDSSVLLELGSWRIPGIFDLIQKKGSVPQREMWRTFNMGIGMAVILRPESVPVARKALPELVTIGRVIRGKREVILS
ncbi:MAG: phosphoribosylformylglycinamidine cyclo-ligase [Elusimicrobia bacterium]|nr:phosphoribosylformylglycinamidine cyclo-ligase [Elusimicrobiota bacterium]